MRLIDAEKIDNYLGEYADEWYESEEEHGGDFMDGYCWTLNRLQDEKRFPTVDAVPVIRCKDCIYYKQIDDTGYGRCRIHHEGKHGEGMTRAERFCSWAEREEE